MPGSGTCSRVIVVGARLGTPQAESMATRFPWPTVSAEVSIIPFLKQVGMDVTRSSGKMPQNQTTSRTLAFLDDQIRSGKCQLSKGAVLDVGASNGFQHVSMDQCPCITRTISGSKRLWFVNPEKKFIQLTTAAYAALQGFPANFVPKSRSVGLSRGHAFSDLRWSV